MADDSNSTCSLSDLDKDVLGLIVSLLPFKEALRTRILAKRWADIWHSTSSIELLESFFVKLDASEEEKELQKNSFLKFVRECVANCSASELDSFFLTFSQPQSYYEDIQNCFEFVNGRFVKELTLDFHDPMWELEDGQVHNHIAAFCLPEDMHHYHLDLESLKLFSCDFISSELYNFRALKELSLGWIPLNVNTIDTLLEDLRSLESLCLNRCWNIERINIVSSNERLHHLVLDNCDVLDSSFHIMARNLWIFKYIGKVGRFYFDNTLVEVEFDFTPELELQEHGDLFHNLLAQLRSVRILTVCSYMLQDFSKEMAMVQNSTLLNVRDLTLKTSDMDWKEICGIGFMLERCPILDTLTINIGPPRNIHNPFPPYQFCFGDLLFCNCVRFALEVVDVKGFRGSSKELDLLASLLHYGKNMKEMKLYLSELVGANDENMREEYLERARMVQYFHKASSKVTIEIHD